MAIAMAETSTLVHAEVHASVEVRHMLRCGIFGAAQVQATLGFGRVPEG